MPIVIVFVQRIAEVEARRRARMHVRRGRQAQPPLSGAAVQVPSSGEPDVAGNTLASHLRVCGAFEQRAERRHEQNQEVAWIMHVQE
ncbi:hypothetical protein [Burkholderia cepacia]|uniref:hypothetical protein n=1 Tax=Burkholderia TaxID=32008 RepID=UPI00103B8EBA